jgi:hypothetical protein
MEENTLKKYDFNQKFSRCEDRDAFYDMNCSNPLIINIESLTPIQNQLFNQIFFS